MNYVGLYFKRPYYNKCLHLKVSCNSSVRKFLILKCMILLIIILFRYYIDEGSVMVNFLYLSNIINIMHHYTIYLVIMARCLQLSYSHEERGVELA